jgi:AGZA family xanthine/uracil permease-like MFS transporter
MSRFAVAERGSSARVETLAGVTTFMAMSYIVFVQPSVVGAAGMDPGAVFVATCLASAIGSLLMALFADYPIALAPAMGHNFFFVYTVVLANGTPWPVALGAVAVAGLLFIATAGIGLRERVLRWMPESLQHAIAVGIGLLIAFIGLQWAGIVVDAPGSLVALGPLMTRPIAVFATGFIVMSALMVRGVRGALLIGMLAGVASAIILGVVTFQGVVSLPPSLAPTWFKLDIAGALSWRYLDVIAIFFMLALFDSVGTLVGVSSRIGVMRDGQMPRMRQALLADATATVVGAALGTSTVTAYIESSAGVAAGGRTGLANVVTAGLFVLALFFSPLMHMIVNPVVAPALVLVGVMMMAGVTKVRWDDPAEAIPAFLTIVVTPLTFSIAAGVVAGLGATVIMALWNRSPQRRPPTPS